MLPWGFFICEIFIFGYENSSKSLIRILGLASFFSTYHFCFKEQIFFHEIKNESHKWWSIFVLLLIALFIINFYQIGMIWPNIKLWCTIITFHTIFSPILVEYSNMFSSKLYLRFYFYCFIMLLFYHLLTLEVCYMNTLLWFLLNR